MHLKLKIDLKTPAEIYQRLNAELAHIIGALNSPTSDVTLEQVQDDARELLTQYQGELREQLDQLEKNAEWNTFTIAFYGETGAGKSTIIETLRILLQERGKLADQQAFRQLRARYSLHEEKLQQLEHAIGQAENHNSKLMEDVSATLQHHEQQHADLLASISRLQTLIGESKRTASFWQKLLNLFKKTQEEIELGQAQDTLASITAARDSASTALRQQQVEAERDRLILAQQQQDISSKMAELLPELEQRADGAIIGDGRADFTRETRRYDFEVDGQPFALLDVPGIEGNEELIRSHIAQAVQTAHAVFYVTNKAAPPQTGDELRKGTLEKIKEHLGAQTEVWTIFNKKVTNPKHSLRDRPLLSNDEEISLGGLNEKMREQLGSHYRDVFPLTALPALLASTDHFAPGSQNAKRRSKILEDFTATDLLEKSRLRDFLQFLNGELVRDGKGKIIRANFNKAKNALDQANTTLAEVQQNFTELAEKLDQDGESAKAQLNSSFKALKSRLHSRAETLIDSLESDVRQDVYTRIDRDISNDTFKEILKNQISTKLEHLGKQLPEAMNVEIGTFQKDAEDILTRFEEYAKELTDIYSNIGNSKLNHHFDFKIKIDNGINIVGLLGGLVGVVLAPFTGGASLWVAGAAALTALISVGKAIWGALSSNYKKSQQREATGKALRKVTEELRASLREDLEKVLPDMQRTISQLEEALEAPAKQATTLVQSLTRSNDQLKALSRRIAHTGNL